MSFNRQFRIYEERFNQPLLTGHGLWERRRSLILREETDGGDIAYGEIAPTPGFSENEIESYTDEARAWVGGEDLFQSPLFLSALSCLSCEIWENESKVEEKPVYTAVLNIDEKNEDPFSKTIKRKIGLRPIRQEIEEVLSWISACRICIEYGLMQMNHWILSHCACGLILWRANRNWNLSSSLFIEINWMKPLIFRRGRPFVSLWMRAFRPLEGPGRFERGDGRDAA